MAWVIISEGAYIWNRKSASKQALALPIKIRFAFTGTGKMGSNIIVLLCCNISSSLQAILMYFAI